jgi:hypothetical protein
MEQATKYRVTKVPVKVATEDQQKTRQRQSHLETIFT